MSVSDSIDVVRDSRSSPVLSDKGFSREESLTGSERLVALVSNAVRIPFIVITLVAQVAKVLLKLTIINVVQLVFNSFINIAIAVKNIFTEHQTKYKYFTLPGCDMRSMGRNFHATTGFLLGSSNAMIRLFVPPSRQEYENNTFPLFLKVCKWVLLEEYEEFYSRADRLNLCDDTDDDSYPCNAILDDEFPVVQCN